MTDANFFYEFSGVTKPQTLKRYYSYIVTVIALSMLITIIMVKISLHTHTMPENLNCVISAKTGLPRLTVVQLNLPCSNCHEALRQANDVANRRLGENMLLS